MKRRAKYPELVWNENLPETYISKYTKNGPMSVVGRCWQWTAGHLSSGYGSFRFQKIHYLPHRLMYAYAVAAIEEGQEIDHRCHNKSCVNPEHLRVSTHYQNKQNYQGVPAHNKSGVRGVYWDKIANGWRVYVQHRGVQYTKRGFRTLADAEQYAINLRNRLHTHNDADRRAS